MKVSVVIPSYHRPEALRFCLAAIAAQVRPPDECIVAIRDDDQESAALLEDASWVTVVTVDRPGAVHAMTAGALASTGSVIAFTDDDARPHPDWIARLVATFDADPRIAAVGGRDVIFDGDHRRPVTLTTDVGRLTWFGRLVGNHHRGEGGPRDVVVLKGVNSSYRRESLALPAGLRGAGTQIHFEVAMGLHIVTSGGRLVYDSSIQVDHHPAERQDADKREAPPASAIAGHAYNLTMSIAMLGMPRLLLRCLYAIGIGDAAMPGLGRAAVLALQRSPHVMVRLRGAVAGNLAATRDALRGRRPTFIRPEPVE